MDRAKIERFAADADVPAGWIGGLSDAQLDAHPVEGTWSIRQLLVHMMDSDLVGSFRMKLVIAHDEPMLMAYDQDEFVERLDYDRQDATDAVRAFAANRRVMAGVLRNLPDEAFARCGMHEESGRMTLEDLVDVYIRHVAHHETFLRAKRDVLGAPLDEIASAES